MKLARSAFVVLIVASCALSDTHHTLTVAPESNLPTITSARNHIRARRAKGEWLDTPITVRIAPGTYILNEPITFSAEDSGTSDAPITYTSADDETAIISGGVEITGWREVEMHGTKAWAAKLSSTDSTKGNFHTLYVNDAPRYRPRRPDTGFYRFTGVPDLDPKAGYRPGQKRAQYDPEHIQPFRNPADVEIVIFHYWVSPRMQIESVDAENHLVNFTAPTMRRLTSAFDINELARYYVDNVFEDLDTPGQWYHDQPAETLYYIPLPHETLDNTTITVPHLEQLLRIEGSSHLSFNNLVFANSKWYDAQVNASDRQSATDVPGAIYLDNAKDCTFTKCAVRNVCNYAIEIATKCQDITIDRCRMSQLGAGGVKIGHDSRRTTVTNCDIGPGGSIFHNAIGVWIGLSHDNRIAHNEIHDFYYSGVSVGWTWGYKTPSQASDNIVEFNHIHDLGKGWLSDMAGVYTLGVSPGTIIRNNIIHDVQADHYGGWGLYTDEGSSQIVMENNIVYRTTHGGFHQHYGKDNIIRNNIFAFSKHAQLMRTKQEEHNSFTFEHNIVYLDTEELLGSNWSNDKFTIDHNLYWREAGQPIDFKNATLEQWQARGHDQHSLIADPLFADPKKGDFTLPPNSPTHKINFKPIATENIGIQREASPSQSAETQKH